MFDSCTVPFAFHGTRLTFHLAKTLFSSAGIDAGSALLLRYLQEHLGATGEKVLDVGCGHGVLGVVLAALDPSRAVTFVDRDALACEYTRWNLEANGLDGQENRIIGSVGYDDVPRDAPFDIVVSNIPGKAGDRPIEELVLGAAAIGKVGTTVGLVVVTALAAHVDAVVAGGPFEVIARNGNRAHTVVIATVTGSPAAAEDGVDGTGAWRPAFGRGVYDREELIFGAGRASWPATTVTGVDEFDELSYATRQLARLLRSVPAQRTVVVNPGQGHRAFLTSLAGHDLRALVARDLLSLRASARMLGDGGRKVPELAHVVTVPDELLAGAKMLVMHADDKVHLPWLRSEAERHLDRQGRRVLVLTGKASVLGRLEAELLRRRPGRVTGVWSERGHRAVAYVQGDR